MQQLSSQDFIALAWIAGAAIVGIVLHRVVYALLARWAKRSQSATAAAIIRQAGRPSAYILPLAAILLIFPLLAIPPQWSESTEHLTELLTIAAVSWTIVTIIRVWSDVVVARHRADVENAVARQLGTRVDILSRTAIVIVVVLALGSMLMTFPAIRAFGTTLLASAGVAGLIVGLAARPLFENVVAGVQLALTQPIRLDDFVIVEKQPGRVEEIRTTYVVVRLLDLRRMVLPLTYFINTPFENWSLRQPGASGQIAGEIIAYADYGLDVAALREALPGILAGSPRWDGGIATIEVTDLQPGAVQIRVVASARGSAELYDLRNFVREALLEYLRKQDPSVLPRSRGQTVAT